MADHRVWFWMAKESALILHSITNPETPLWAKQQFPRGNCQDELMVISGAHSSGRHRYQRLHHWKEQRVYNSGRGHVFESMT